MNNRLQYCLTKEWTSSELMVHFLLEPFMYIGKTNIYIYLYIVQQCIDKYTFVTSLLSHANTPVAIDIAIDIATGLRTVC